MLGKQNTASLRTNRLYCYYQHCTQNISLLKSYSEVNLKKNTGVPAKPYTGENGLMFFCFSICKYVHINFQRCCLRSNKHFTYLCLYVVLQSLGQNLRLLKNFIKKCYPTIILTYFDAERILLLHLNGPIYSYLCYDAILTYTV